MTREGGTATREARVARTMLTAITLSSIGFGIQLLALGQLLYERTGSAESFALILTLQGVVALCVLPLCGPLVDALSSKRVYATCGVARAVTVVGIVFLATGPDEVPVAFIVGSGALLAAFTNVERSALFKFTAHHISSDRIVTFNTRVGIAFQAGVLAGMALLGLLLIWTGAAQALLVDVVMTTGCVLAVASLRLSASEHQAPLSGALLRAKATGMLGEWRRMLRTYRGTAAVFAMIFLCAADFVFAHSLSTLVVPLVAEHYGDQSWYISALEGTFAVGMLTASLFSRHLVRQRLLPLWLLVQAAAALLLIVADTGVLLFLAFFAAGFANLNSLTWLLTSLQQHAHDGDKAKMASLRLAAIGLGTALLLPIVGRASSSSLGAGFAVTAVVMAVFAVPALWVARAYRPRPAAPAPVPAPSAAADGEARQDITRHPAPEPATSRLTTKQGNRS